MNHCTLTWFMLSSVTVSGTASPGSKPNLGSMVYSTTIMADDGGGGDDDVDDARSQRGAEPSLVAADGVEGGIMTDMVSR